MSSIVIAGSIPAPERYSGSSSLTEECGELRVNIRRVLILLEVTVIGEEEVT